MPHIQADYAAERDNSTFLGAKDDSTRDQGIRKTKDMKKEYDFSKAERGRFYKKGATLRLPIYLDATVQDEVEDLANRTGRNVRDVVNRIVQKQVRLIEEFETQKKA